MALNPQFGTIIPSQQQELYNLTIYSGQMLELLTLQILHSSIYQKSTKLKLKDMVTEPYLDS